MNTDSSGAGVGSSMMAGGGAHRKKGNSNDPECRLDYVVSVRL